MTGKPCERCGAFDGKADDSYKEFGQDDKEPSMCSEVHVAFGLISFLCYNCRKEYHRFAKGHPHNRKYGEIMLRLEFWKDRVGSDTRPESIDEGLQYFHEIEDLELKINEVANHWFISDLDEIRVN